MESTVHKIQYVIKKNPRFRNQFKLVLPYKWVQDIGLNEDGGKVSLIYNEELQIIILKKP